MQLTQDVSQSVAVVQYGNMAHVFLGGGFYLYAILLAFRLCFLRLSTQPLPALTVLLLLLLLVLLHHV
jgi:hypothetical protein